MNNIVLPIIIILLTIISTSCELEKELDYNGYADFTPCIVVHGFISPNSGVEVAVRAALPVNNIGSDSYLADAEITLFEDEIPLFSLTEADSGFFVSPPGFIPSIRKGYYIEVNAPGFSKVKSKTQYILPEIPIDSLALVYDSITHQGRFLHYRFNDPPGISNYYHINYLSTELPEPVFNSNGTECFILGSFDDTEFDGATTWQSIHYYDNINNPETKVINLYLFNISEEFKQFLDSLDEYEYTRETIFFPVTSSVYSNITGGFGIFTTYTYTTKYITIEPT